MAARKLPCRRDPMAEEGVLRRRGRARAFWAEQRACWDRGVASGLKYRMPREVKCKMGPGKGTGRVEHFKNTGFHWQGFNNFKTRKIALLIGRQHGRFILKCVLQ